MTSCAYLRVGFFGKLVPKKFGAMPSEAWPFGNRIAPPLVTALGLGYR
jgi:hypothetical protein